MNRMTSDKARSIAAMRESYRGGRTPTCECGECRKCKKRLEMRRYRLGRKQMEPHNFELKDSTKELWNQ